MTDMWFDHFLRRRYHLDVCHRLIKTGPDEPRAADVLAATERSAALALFGGGDETDRNRNDQTLTRSDAVPILPTFTFESAAASVSVASAQTQTGEDKSLIDPGPPVPVWENVKVCAYAVLGLCPYNELQNTAYTVGPCPFEDHSKPQIALAAVALSETTEEKKRALEYDWYKMFGRVREQVTARYGQTRTSTHPHTHTPPLSWIEPL